MRGDWIFAWRLAFRSLGRNRKRSAITLSAVSLSVAFLLMEFGFVAGLEQQSVNIMIDQDYGHIKVVPPGFDPMEPAYDSLLAQSDFSDSLLRLPGLVSWTPRLKFTAILSNGLDEYPCQGLGVTLSSDSAVFDLVRSPLQGRFWKPGEQGIVIGSGVARAFGIAAPSDTTLLTLVGRSALGAYGAFDLPMLGIVNTGYPAIDRNGVILPLDLAQDLLAAPGKISEITLRLKENEGANDQRLVQARMALQGSLTRARLKAEALDWRRQAADFLAILHVRKVSSHIASLFFILIAVMGVANAVLIAAFERTGEVGMLRALGMRPAEIMWQFLYEGAVLGLVGGLLGGLLGTLVVLYFQTWGINLTALYGNTELALPIKDVLYSRWRLDTLLEFIAGATLLSALAAYFPALRTSKLSPAEALRK